MKQILSILLIASHLAIALAPHVGHSDEMVGGGARAELRGDTCGANESHKSTKDHGDCLLCSRTTHFVAFVVCALFSTHYAVTFLCVVDPLVIFSYRPPSTLFLRGPPTTLS